MLIESKPTAAAHVLAIFPEAESPEEMTTKIAAFIKAVCDQNAMPTDGLSKSQSSLVWQRQIALDIASRSYGMSSDHACLLQAMAEAERTVWDAHALDRLADDLMTNAAMVADEWRGEAEVLRGEI